MSLYSKKILAGASAIAVFASLVSAPASAQIDEIMVTAQKKEQGLQDTSLALDALSGAELLKDGINNAASLTAAVPALTITNGGGINGQVYMRGVGNSGANNYLDPAIILNYDGVAVSRGAATSIGAFYDISRLEVLKGPQGTLYGKNATGGVLNIVPNRPELGVTGGGFGASFGNYNSQDLSAHYNLPIGDKSALRVAGSIVKHDGYNKDGTNDDDRKSIRGQFLTEFSEDVTVRIAADYTDIGGVGTGTTPVGRYSRVSPGNFEFIPNGLPTNEGSRTRAAQDYRNTILAAPGFGFLNDIQDEWYTDGELWGVNAEVNIALGEGALTIIPAYRESSQDSRFGQPGFNSGWWQNSAEQLSFEVNYANSTGGVDYIIGGYWFDENIAGNNTFNQEFVLPLQDYTSDNKAWAVFGEATFNINETTRAIVGGRYTEDEKTMDGDINNFIVFCGGIGPNLITPGPPPNSFTQGCAVPGNLPHWPTLDTPEQAYAYLNSTGFFTGNPIPIPPGFLIPLDNGVGQILHSIEDVDATISSNEPTYRFVLEKDILEDSLVFASFSRGYRSGGLEPTGNIFNPEFINAYTIGMKNTFANGTLQLNAEAFWWDYKDQQISYFNLNDDGVLQNNTQNVGKATNKGIELDMIWLATENTVIDATVQYLDATYDELFFRSTIPRDNINCPSSVVGLTDEGDPDLLFDCSGNQAIFSPEWTIMAGIEQTFPLDNGLQLVADINTRYVSDQVGGFNNLEHANIDSYTTTGASLTLEPQEGGWYMGAYVRNLEDKNRMQSTQTPLLGAGFISVGPDMTYGVRFGADF